MLNKIIKISFSVVGGITGFTLTNTILSLSNAQTGLMIQITMIILSAIFCGVLFYLAGDKTIELVTAVFDKTEKIVQNLSLYELAISSIGSIVGLIIANLIVIPIKNIAIIGLPLALFANVFFACIFFSIGLVVGKRNDSIIDSSKFAKNTAGSFSGKKLLDTCTIIDGRILDIVRTGCIDGNLIVPDFVLEELRLIADSSDSLKRAKGKRGLDILNILQKEFADIVSVKEFEGIEGNQVDDKLLKAAKKINSTVITIDMNLNKVASVHGVKVLNINDLSNAVKPVALPGDEMKIQVVKDGKEPGQGLGYLEDGTMIVVENGKNYIGQSISVTVTSHLQTSAGRMIFAKPN
ncbi:PIN/TRAM domain-containing protein [Pseudobacteroides cellulosolvens]|uniref:Nucleotide binding protein PINc n=1 Tax=Pseudobacteroides cellulosolvens ATCC 35603 = DSM 2933 TaxID=398512 RepID=A0A0L6JY33_9FIRM|nr:PIN/TRAM domain-containing protein [Pseudobacteroides cellulosolvens]KNY30362.1 Nucleotide binding protein PINc [Pseudobacteroides cellulosolvens ATCC 35603 = DSM 2933]